MGTRESNREPLRELLACTLHLRKEHLVVTEGRLIYPASDINRFLRMLTCLQIHHVAANTNNIPITKSNL